MITNKARERYDELQVMAMLFDMDIDIETWSLVPRNEYKEPYWLTRWKEKEYAADQDNRLDYWDEE